MSTFMKRKLFILTSLQKCKISQTPRAKYCKNADEAMTASQENVDNTKYEEKFSHTSY